MPRLSAALCKSSPPARVGREPCFGGCQRKSFSEDRFLRLCSRVQVSDDDEGGENGRRRSASDSAGRGEGLNHVRPAVATGYEYGLRRRYPRPRASCRLRDQGLQAAVGSGVGRANIGRDLPRRLRGRPVLRGYWRRRSVRDLCLARTPPCRPAPELPRRSFPAGARACSRDLRKPDRQIPWQPREIRMKCN